MSDGETLDPVSGGAAAALLGTPPAGDPPAGDLPAGDPLPGDDGGVDPAFYADISADLGDGETASNRDWIKAKGFKDLDAVTKALRSAEKTIHDKGTLKLPGEGASAEERAAFNKAIGVPETIEGYAIKAPLDGEGNPVQLDKGLLDRLAATAHKAGMPADGFKALVGDVIAQQLEQLAGDNAAGQAEAREWATAQGDKQAVKLAAVDRGADALGLEDGEVFKLRQSLGSKRTMDLLARLGEGVGEDVLGSGGGSRTSFVGGDQAQAEIQRMMGDPKQAAAIFVKGSPENVRYNRLQGIVGEAANRRAAGGG